MSTASKSSRANYLTLAVLFDSHVVADVPALLPVTATTIYFPLNFLVNARVDLVALEIGLHFLGTIMGMAETFAEQEYHW